MNRSVLRSVSLRAQPLQFRREVSELFKRVGVRTGDGALYVRVGKWVIPAFDVPAFIDAGFAHRRDLLRARYVFLSEMETEPRWFLPRERKYLKVSAFQRTKMQKDVVWTHAADLAQNREAQSAFNDAGVVVPSTQYDVETNQAHEELVSPLGTGRVRQDVAQAFFVALAANKLLQRGVVSLAEYFENICESIAVISTPLSRQLNNLYARCPGFLRKVDVPLSFVHGDASRGNLCLNRTGTPVLLDFDKSMIASQTFDLAFLAHGGELPFNQLKEHAARLFGKSTGGLSDAHIIPFVRLLFALDLAHVLKRLDAQVFRAAGDRRCRYTEALLAAVLHDRTPASP